MALTSEDIVYKLATGMFGAAPGPYLDALVAEYDAVGLEQLAINLGNSSLFRSLHPTSQGGHVFAGSFLADFVPGYQPSNPAHLSALNWLAGEFDRGVPPGLVVLEALQALYAVSPTDPTWGATREQWDHWVDMAHRVDLAGGVGNNLDELQDAVRAPVFQSAEVNGATLVMHYADLNGLAPNPLVLATSFNVLVGGVSSTISSVAVNGSTDTVTLTLATAVPAGAVVTVSYTDPTALDDSRAIQDTYGNDALTITAKAVTNTTPDIIGPVFASADVKGATLVMTYTDASALDATHVPAVGAFTVMAGNSTVVVSNVAVDAAAKTVTLTLETPVTDSQVVTVAYKDPTTGNDTAALQDALGNDASSLTATKATNSTPDSTGPVFDTATVDGKTLVMTFKDASVLEDSTASGPATTAFAVKVGGVTDTVTGVAVNADARTVTLTLTTAATFGQTVTVAYTDPTAADDARALQDGLGNDAPTFAATEVTNDSPDTTAPVFVSATVKDSTLVMTYTEATTLDATASHLPLAGAFTVMVNGKADVVTGVTAANGVTKTVSLALTTPVLDGQTVTVAYTDTTKGSDDTRAIQDAAGNDALSLATTTITNTTPDTTAPTFTSATVNGSSLVMTYSDLHALDAKNIPEATAFTVTRGGAADLVNSVIVSATNNTVTLMLDTAVSGGEVVKVAYTDPSGSNDIKAIQDVAGNDAATFALTTVTNNTVIDSVAPVYASAAVDGSTNTLVLTYTESTTLDAGNPPSKGDFSVYAGVAGTTSVAVMGVSVNAGAKTVTLTLAPDSVANGDVVKVSYTDPTVGNDANAIQDAAGNDAASITNKSVTNNTPDTTPPVLTTATVEGSTLVLHYSDLHSLDTTNIPIAGRFAVTDGGTPINVTGVAVDATSVTLTLETPASYAGTVLVSYTKPSAGNDTLAIQDLAGNDAVNLTSHTVNHVDTIAPVFSAATITNDVLVMTYVDAGALDAAHLPAVGDFTVQVGGSADVVTNVAINALTVTLTLTTPATNGQAVTVAYNDLTPVDGNAIQDGYGNAAVAILVGQPQSVTNDTP